MKTLRNLKIAFVFNGIFCLSCILSTTCFAVARYFDSRLFFDIGNIFIYGWIINPIGIISFLFCLVPFLRERKAPEDRQAMGKKWIWIFLWPIITTLMYFAAGMLTVAFTGGV